MKYGKGKGGWSTKVCRRAYGCGLWRSISERWESFSKHLTFVVGDGSHIYIYIYIFGMIGGLRIILSKLFTLGYMSVQTTRKLIFLMFLCLPMDAT